MASTNNSSGRLFIRDISAFALFETFLVTAVSSILLTRFYLALTDYPMISTRTLHIAHMLWGGLFMVIALIILLTFLTHRAKYIASIVGGIGFGLFIDQLGKFITRDNNYFFQPTVALIYVTFILLLLLFQSIEKYRRYSKDEYLINAVELLKDVVTNDLDTEEKRKMLSYLRKSGNEKEIIPLLRDYLRGVEARPKGKPNIFIQLKITLATIYQALTYKRWFSNLIIIFFVFQAIISLAHVAIVFLFSISSVDNKLQVAFTPHTISQQGQLIFTTISALFIVIGILRMHKSRLLAYHQFKRALLISIFLTQVFAFYRTQFYGLIGLAGDILLLIGIEYMITQEEQISKLET